MEEKSKAKGKRAARSAQRWWRTATLEADGGAPGETGVEHGYTAGPRSV